MAKNGVTVLQLQRDNTRMRRALTRIASRAADLTRVSGEEEYIDTGDALDVLRYVRNAARRATKLPEVFQQGKVKRFSETQNVGKARYVVNFHDGVKKHRDGSDFMDVRIFKTKALKDRFVRGLLAQGYREDT